MIFIVLRSLTILQYDLSFYCVQCAVRQWDQSMEYGHESEDTERTASAIERRSLAKDNT
jgi:hypothetical protein